MTVVSVISLPKQRIQFLVPFYRAYFSNPWNCLHQEFNPRHFLGVSTFVSVISFSEQQLWTLRHSSIAISYLATEIIFAENRNQENFGGSHLCFFTLLLEINNFILGAILQSWFSFELQKTFPLGTESRRVSRDCDPQFCNILFETALALVPFFYGSLLPSHQNIPHRNSKSGHFFRIFTFLYSFHGLKE